MTLLELVNDFGLDLKKTSNSRGGEYHSACPGCGEGLDRFVIWPQLNRYWCRRCGISGDAIQFCRDFMRMSFREACERVKDTSRLFNHQVYQQPERLIKAVKPPKMWQDKALIFVEWAQRQLVQFPQAMEDLCKRGLKESTISQFKLGYCYNFSAITPQDFYRDRSSWGLPCEYRQDCKERKLWLPNGLVIPTISSDGCILKIKVRRNQWSKKDPLPKYVEISGSMQCPSLYGDLNREVIVVLESELDAMLIQQETMDLCFCIALGGVSKRPDFYTDHLLRKAKLILWSLDNDEAGKKAALWWRETYPHLKFWPAPIGKSPGDASKDHGINLRDWILKGIKHHSN